VNSVRSVTVVTTAPAATREVGGVVASVLRPGDVIGLDGELGAGKTCFVQGAASALGVAERVTSPSFLLRRTYRGRLPVVHLDVYRLDRLAEVDELGGDELFDPHGVTFVEWGDAMSPLLPPERLSVELVLPAVDEAAPLDVVDEPRVLTLAAHGPSWLRRLPQLAELLAPWRQD